jgi:hypothetical protein
MTTRAARLLAFALLLGSCSLPGARPGKDGSAVHDAAACRVGPDGGPLPGRAANDDRGIGGTGAASGAARFADRGIGGTGITSEGSHLSDQGIGGTGIVGIITGFGSVCLDGQEIALERTTPVLIDGERALGEGLRAGQVAAVRAEASGAALAAHVVTVRHEVSGPVEAVEPDGALRVAGQRVVASTETWGRTTLHPGDWVAVSGLRAPGGEITASRLDPRPPGSKVTVHGELTHDGDILRIGTLEVRPAAGQLASLSARYVTASGHERDGVLFAEAVTADVLVEKPDAYFGRDVRTLVLEAYATSRDGRVQLGPGLDVAAASDLGSVPSGLAVVELARRADGSLVATHISRTNGGSGGLHGPTQTASRPGPGIGPGPGPGQVPGFGLGPGPGPGFGPGPAPGSGFGPGAGFGAGPGGNAGGSGHGPPGGPAPGSAKGNGSPRGGTGQSNPGSNGRK